MKLAIVTYEFNPAVGAALALVRLRDSLLHIDPDAQITIFDVAPKPCPAATEQGVVHVPSNAISITNEEFDVVLLNEPTYNLQNSSIVNNYLTMVSSIKRERTHLWIQGEYGIVQNYKKFHEYFDLVRTIVDRVYTIAPKLEEFYRANIDPAHTNFGRLPGCGRINTDVDPSDWILRKLIGYCCRITTMKKPNNFLRLMHHLGKTPSMHGKVEGGIQNVKMQSLVEEFGWNWDDIYHGEFFTEKHPTKWGMNVNIQRDYCFTWNATMIGKGNNIGLAPRIELTTIESWQGGSIPILLEETVPDYIPRECYVSVNWLDINHIGRDWDKVKDHVREQMTKFCAMSPTTREALARKALEALEANWPVTASYQKFLMEG